MLKLKDGSHVTLETKSQTLKKLIPSQAQAEVKTQDQWPDLYINWPELRMPTFLEATNTWDMDKKLDLNQINTYTERSLALLVTSIVQLSAPKSLINKLLACQLLDLMPTAFGFLITLTQMLDLRCKEKLSSQESHFSLDTFKLLYILVPIPTLSIRMTSELKMKFIVIITQPKIRVKI